MIRKYVTERLSWQEKVENLGFHFHSASGKYWDESACYVFSMAEIEKIESATEELFEMCMNVVENAIADKRLSEWHIPYFLQHWIGETWEWDDPTIYGRFDLGMDTAGNIKLLEFNADTPTSLLEASVVQWNWLQDVNASKDQYNSIHETLLEQFAFLKNTKSINTLHFASSAEQEEDYMTVAYMMDCATQAGLEVVYLTVEEIGWNGTHFVDNAEQPIQKIFKLYPWEFMWDESFGKHLTTASTVWIEPAWKMLLSNKILLAALWEMYPNHPLLLPTFTQKGNLEHFVEKPIWGREGANVRIFNQGNWLAQTEGEYNDNPKIYQSYMELPNFNNNRPVIGSWIVGDTPCGIGIRETNSLVHDNLSRFVPHYIEK